MRRLISHHLDARRTNGDTPIPFLNSHSFLTAPDDTAPAASEFVRQRSRKLQPSLRIVVADDEHDERRFLEMALTYLGHRVVAVAQDGRQLVEHCRQARPDLVITDVKMPHLSGLDAMAEINRDGEVPAVLVSAYPEAELLAGSGGRPGYIVTWLTKPVRTADLQAAVTLAVADGRAGSTR
jgi:CheY-like chemotaxis protein